MGHFPEIVVNITTIYITLDDRKYIVYISVYLNAPVIHMCF